MEWETTLEQATVLEKVSDEGISENVWSLTKRGRGVFADGK